MSDTGSEGIKYTGAPLNIAEVDGSPSVFPYKFIVPNGSLTDNGDGTSALDFVGGSLPTTYLKLDQSTPQTTIGTFTFPHIIADIYDSTDTYKMIDVSNYTAPTFGAGASVVGVVSIAIGENASVSGTSGNYCVALGGNANAQGDYCLAIGYGTSAAPYASTAVGNSANTDANNSTALGNCATVATNAHYGIAIGNYAYAANENEINFSNNDSTYGVVNANSGYTQFNIYNGVADFQLNNITTYGGVTLNRSPSLFYLKFAQDNIFGNTQFNPNYVVGGVGACNYITWDTNLNSDTTQVRADYGSLRISATPNQQFSLEGLAATGIWNVSGYYKFLQIGIGLTSRVSLENIAEWYYLSADRIRLSIGNAHTGLDGSRSTAISFYGYDNVPIYGGQTLQAKWEMGTDYFQNGTHTFYIYDSLNAAPRYVISASGNTLINNPTEEANIGFQLSGAGTFNMTADVGIGLGYRTGTWIDGVTTGNPAVVIRNGAGNWGFFDMSGGSMEIGAGTTGGSVHIVADNLIYLSVLTGGTIQMPYYTTNGFVKFSSSNGTLAVDTTTYYSSGSSASLAGLVITNAGATLAGVFDVAWNSANAAGAYRTFSNTATHSGVLLLEHTRGTWASQLATSAGDTLGQLNFGGFTNARYIAAAIIGLAATGWGASGADVPGTLAFQTCPDGSSTLATNWSILSTGNLVSSTAGAGTQAILTAGTITGGAFSCTSLTDSGLTSGRIPFAGTSGLLGDSSLFLFATATGLSVNTTTAYRVQSTAAYSGQSWYHIKNTTTTGSAGVICYNDNEAGYFAGAAYGSAYGLTAWRNAAGFFSKAEFIIGANGGAEQATNTIRFICGYLGTPGLWIQGSNSVGVAAYVEVGGMTAGRVPFFIAGTNAPRISNDADFTFVTDTLTITKLVISTSITTVGGTAPAADGTYALPTSITIKSGIITAIS